MAKTREFLEKARWFPAKIATGFEAGALSGDTPLATNGFLSAMLPPEDRERLREINVRLTEMAIAQCGAAARAAADGLAHGARILEAWQNLSAPDVPDALSSVFVAIANKSGTVPISANGEFRVDDKYAKDPEGALRDILNTHWLKHLPPPLNQHPGPAARGAGYDLFKFSQSIPAEEPPKPAFSRRQLASTC